MGAYILVISYLKIDFQQVALPEEKVKELVAEFHDVESKVTFITPVVLWTPLFPEHFIHCFLW